jgi:hypothetical protein
MDQRALEIQSAEAVIASLRVVKRPKIFDGMARHKAYKLLSIHRAISDVSLPGDFAEFGVWKGACARYTTKFIFGERKLHLFDSFEGLPTDWVGKFKKGHFNLGGNIPKFNPNKTVVYKGWFSDTVPAFAKSLKAPLSFIHMDADLYSSTMDVLIPLNDKIAKGTIVLFDEYLFKGLDDEHRALIDWSKRCDRRFDYLWRTKGPQVAIKIVE